VSQTLKTLATVQLGNVAFYAVCAAACVFAVPTLLSAKSTPAVVLGLALMLAFGFWTSFIPELVRNRARYLASITNKEKSQE